MHRASRRYVQALDIPTLKGGLGETLPLRVKLAEPRLQPGKDIRAHDI